MTARPLVHLLRLLTGLLLLLPMSTLAAEESVAAVELRSADATLRFADGSEREVRFRRAGIAYRERVAPGVFMGFTAGYSENESAARPVATAGGVYGSLDLHFEAPLAASLALQGKVAYLLQRDRGMTAAGEFEARAWETRAEIGPRWQYRRLAFFAGVSWRDVDYRETVSNADGETVRRAEAADAINGFAGLGLNTDNGEWVSLRFDDGGETAWTLSFSRNF